MLRSEKRMRNGSIGFTSAKEHVGLITSEVPADARVPIC
jgi:hypothetical protein